jgi:capsular polysaccharide biosynthesis protein
LAAEIKKIDHNRVILTNNRDKLINSKSQNDILAGFLYITTSQQNVDLRNKISNQILDYNSELEKERRDSKRIQIIIDILSREIENLKQKRDKINNIQVVQPPKSSPYPIKSRAKRNVLLASTVGLFLMLILSFFLEYTGRNNKKT